MNGGNGAQSWAFTENLHAAHLFQHYLNGGCLVYDTFHFLVAAHLAGLGDRADRVLAATLQR